MRSDEGSSSGVARLRPLSSKRAGSSTVSSDPAGDAALLLASGGARFVVVVVVVVLEEPAALGSASERRRWCWCLLRSAVESRVRDADEDEVSCVVRRRVSSGVESVSSPAS